MAAAAAHLVVTAVLEVHAEPYAVLHMAPAVAAVVAVCVDFVCIAVSHVAVSTLAIFSLLEVHQFWLLQVVTVIVVFLEWRWTSRRHYDFVLCLTLLYLEIYCYARSPWQN